MQRVAGHDGDHAELPPPGARQPQDQGSVEACPGVQSGRAALLRDGRHCVAECAAERESQRECLLGGPGHGAGHPPFLARLPGQLREYRNSCRTLGGRLLVRHLWQRPAQPLPDRSELRTSAHRKESLMPSASEWTGSQPSSWRARSLRVKAPAASPGRRGASTTATGGDTTLLKAATSSRTVVPVPVPRLIATDVAPPSTESNDRRAAT